MNIEGMVQAARAGDEQAFRALVEPYLAGLYRTSALILMDKHLARDAVQEGLLRAYRSLGKIHADAPLGPWLHRLVLNEARRLYSRRRRQPMLIEEVPDVPADETANPEAAVLALEHRQRLWQALGQLDELHRTVIILRYYRSLSELEMADALAVPAGTIKSRLHHARRLLEQRLAEPIAPCNTTPLPLGR